MKSVRSTVAMCFFFISCVYESFGAEHHTTDLKDLIGMESGRSNESRMEQNNHCECGIENDAAIHRIMGGQEVDPPHRFPWMALLLRRSYGKYYVFCGGAVINRQYILTASHCLDNIDESILHVALGVHDSRRYLSGEHPLRVTKLLMHHSYASMFSRNDIGLIKLRDPIIFGPTIRPICMPDSADIEQGGNDVIVAGWGLNYPGGQMNRYLHYADLKIVNRTTCQNLWGEGFVINTNICASGLKGVDSCQGDSGGPLMYKKNDRWYVVGIVSWGHSCGTSIRPGIYNRVSQYTDWINFWIRDAPVCV